MKEASIVKKSDKKSKAKYFLGYEIINKSDEGGRGESKTYNSKYDEDSGVDLDDGDDAAKSAA